MVLAEHSARFVKFCVVGGSGVVVNSGIFYLLTVHAGFHYVPSAIAAIECAIINNFMWNAAWTFKDRTAGGLRAKVITFLKFNISSGLVALCLNVGLDILLVETLGTGFDNESARWKIILQFMHLTGIVLGTIANYFISHFWTFRAVDGTDKV